MSCGGELEALDVAQCSSTRVYETFQVALGATPAFDADEQRANTTSCRSRHIR